MKKNFDQEVADLKSGLKALENIMKDPQTSRIKYEKAKLNIEIQKARIDFCVRGYNFRNKELNAQKKVVSDDELISEDLGTQEKLMSDEEIMGSVPQ